MEAPLLERRSSGELIGDDGDYVPLRGLKEWWRVFCIETVKLWRIGGPIAFQILCQFGTNSVTTMFVGHLGDIELSAFSIAVSVIGTFSFGFMLGMGSALETLCGQAFGAGQVHMLGIYMQRSMLILFSTCVLLLPIYIFATPVLKLLGQEDDIADPAGVYTLLIVPQLFSLAVTFPSQKFLQAQSKVSVLAWIAFLALVAQVFLCWLFLDVFGWGGAGAALAFDLTSWGTAIAQFVYVVGWCKDGWKGSLGWHLKRFGGFMNVNGWEAMVFVGINAAISVRVSNELGLGHPRASKYSVYVTVFQSLLIGILCMIIILVTRNHFSIIFTDSKDMQRAVAHLSGLLGITMVLNSVQPVISGVAVGGGWQALVAYINLACYYIFGLPLGYILGYVANLGVVGLWGGMIAGTAMQTLLLLLVLYKTNWKKEVEQTTERMRKWGGQDIDNEKSASGQLPIRNGRH
ncbi:hypothetical protein DH2020_009917 [Rehmannia glutinosa]|uniref:Protein DETOXIFICATION n=1 Tax=Rehmannia glutinosa TaxID=99300 RepID=A0ABR0X9S8_REHGL